MKSFSIKLNGKQRPVMDLYGNEAIIDTGAVVPMATFSPEVLKLAWDAELVKDNIEIGGISGTTKGSIYRLHDFRIGDFIFDELDIFVSYKKSIQFSFLLSSTLFNGTNFQFDMIDKNNQTFTVNIPDEVELHRHFRLKDISGQIYAEIDGVLLQDDSFDQIEEYDV